MRIRDVLAPGQISLELPGDTKGDIIEALLDLLMAAGEISDRGRALERVLERESRMSTGIQHGVAIPHGKTDAVNRLLVSFGRKTNGIDFDALDGEPSRLFFMTLSPRDSTGPHVELLAEIAALLNDQSVRARLLEAESAEEILHILAD